MNFDKTSPKNRNPQQPKISLHATKKPAQLCGKTAQLATLLQEHVAKFGSALFCCWSLLRTISWVRIFEGSLQVTTVGILPLTTVELRRTSLAAVAYAENFHEGIDSVAYSGHLYLVCAVCVCDVTI